MTTQTDLFNQPRKLHANSAQAYKEDKKPLGGRSLNVLTNIRVHGGGTDRDIAKRMGFAHRSMVQPRVSDLIRMGHLVETGSTICSVTGKTVRLVDVVRATT